MLDIVSVPTGEDLELFVTEVSKAGNVLSVQLQSLEYAPEFGVDLRYFLTSDFRFPNDALKAHFIQRLTESQITVTNVLETLNSLFEKLTFSVGDTDGDIGGFIA